MQSCWIKVYIFIFISNEKKNIWKEVYTKKVLVLNALSIK